MKKKLTYKSVKFPQALLIVFGTFIISMAACHKEIAQTAAPQLQVKSSNMQQTFNVATNSTFIRGADVSWNSEMVAKSQNVYDFYNSSYASNANPPDIYTLLKARGINAVRFRIWCVSAPAYNSTTDVITKAIAAHNAGMKILLDFHYSSIWAGAGVVDNTVLPHVGNEQKIPTDWAANATLANLIQHVTDTTTHVLQELQAKNITPDWVQVGNEVNYGMLFNNTVDPTKVDFGRISNNPDGFVSLIKAGVNAVRTTSPTSKIIIHLAYQKVTPNSTTFNDADFTSVFNLLQANNVDYDIIGISLYPYCSATTDESAMNNTNCQNLMNNLITAYNKDIMIVETGFYHQYPLQARSFLETLISNVNALPQGHGLGVFYWEPEAFNGWSGHQAKGSVGTYDNSGRPTVALDAFSLVGNPGFQVDLPGSHTITSWTSAGTNASAAAYIKVDGQGDTILNHYQNVPYVVNTYQQLTHLAAGSYTLKAWVKCSGGQNLCYMYAGSQRFNIPNTNSQWQHIAITGIQVSNYLSTIGFYSDAAAGNWLNVDDVQFYKE